MGRLAPLAGALGAGALCLTFLSLGVPIWGVVLVTTLAYTGIYFLAKGLLPALEAPPRAEPGQSVLETARASLGRLTERVQGLRDTEVARPAQQSLEIFSQILRALEADRTKITVVQEPLVLLPESLERILESFSALSATDTATKGYFQGQEKTRLALEKIHKGFQAALEKLSATDLERLDNAIADSDSLLGHDTKEGT